MKYDATINILKILATAILDSTSATKNSRKNIILKDPRNVDLNISNSTNNSMNNNNYTESEENNKQCNEGIPSEDSKFYNYNNKINDYYNKKQDTSLNSKGMIESIAQELTPVRLQQAIVLSEIVGKPRSKTRRKRRF